MPNAKRVKITDLKPDPNNANLGTPEGMKMLADSIQKHGVGRSILVDKNGYVIAGNKTIEEAKKAGIKEVILVEMDGNQLVVVQRTDLDLAEDPKTQHLAILDNRVSQVNLKWDNQALLSYAQEYGQEIMLNLFTQDELMAILETPNFAPVPEDDQPRLDEKTPITCPECGYEFTPE